MKYSQLLLLFSSLALGCSAPGASLEEASSGGESTSEPGHGAMMTSSEGHEWEELITQDSALHDALQLTEVDCPSARDLVISICDLAERVCDIAEDTGDGETEERCVDGRSRCERAQDRTANVCP